MNDFTKEELKFLHSAIYERPFSITPKMDEMRSKIQSMIDNYVDLSVVSKCHHRYREIENVEDFSGYKSFKKIKCRLCNVTVEMNYGDEIVPPAVLE